MIAVSLQLVLLDYWHHAILYQLSKDIWSERISREENTWFEPLESKQELNVVSKVTGRKSVWAHMTGRDVES